MTLTTIDGEGDDRHRARHAVGCDHHSPGARRFPGCAVSCRGDPITRTHRHRDADPPSDAEQERLLRQLAELRGEEHPDGTGAGGGIFGRLRDALGRPVTAPSVSCRRRRRVADHPVRPEGAAYVRRIQVGESVDVGDGAGRCRRVSVTGRSVRRVSSSTSYATGSSRHRSPGWSSSRQIAKGGARRDADRSMTEVGVDEIVPWSANRSVVRWDGERGAKALARWRSTAREAAKQLPPRVSPRGP